MKFTVWFEDPELCPSRANPLATGMDVRCSDDLMLYAGETRVLKTGLTLRHEAQYAYCQPIDVQMRGRSGLSAKGLLVHLGTIDADYEGELGVIMTNTSKTDVPIPKYARVAQLVFPAGTRVLVQQGRAPESAHLAAHMAQGHQDQDKVPVRPEAETPKPRGKAGFGSTGLK